MSDDLPPRVPPELPEMDRLVLLLGSRSQGVSMSQRVRAELATLCGVYPDPGTHRSGPTLRLSAVSA